MNNNAIGVFDSGVGGLTAVAELKKLMPKENIIYFGDTARIPYGSRSRETILKYARQDSNFLLGFDIKMLIAACGTVSSVIGNNSLAEGIPFTGVLMPAAQAACSVTRNGRIGVIGTSAAIKSGSYGKAIKSIRPNAFVTGNACPLFVPLVENGFTDRNNEVTRIIAKKYLEPVLKEGIDTLILGCTHYPLLEGVISDICGEGVKLISAGKEVAKFAYGTLSEKELLSDRKEDGIITFYASDSTELFAQNAECILNSRINGKVLKVEIDSL